MVAISVADKESAWRAVVVATQTQVASVTALAKTETCGSNTFGRDAAKAAAERLGTIAADLKRALEPASFRPKLAHSQQATTILNSLSVAATKDAKQ